MSLELLTVSVFQPVTNNCRVFVPLNLVSCVLWKMDVDLDPELIFDINYEHVSGMMRKIIQNRDLRDLTIVAGSDQAKCVHFFLIGRSTISQCGNASLFLIVDFWFIA